MLDKQPIYLAAPRRSPIGAFGKSLSSLTPVDLSLPVAQAVLESAGIEASAVDETLWGHARQAGGGPNTARQVAVRGGIPVERPAMTLNKACGSSMATIIDAARRILLGEREVVLTGGVESMSRTPYMLPNLRFGYRMGHAKVVDGMYQDGFHCPLADQLMGATAETLAERYELSRDEQDRFALASQQKAAAAWERGAFDAEIVPIEVPGRRGEVTVVDRDEHLRPHTTLEKLGRLPAVFKSGGTVHAGNASGVTDGAAGVLVLSGAAAERLGVTPAARLVGYGIGGVDPKVMGLGPVPATQAALERSGWSLADLDLIELNEAFAAQVLACDREMGLDTERLNVHGGSIALGHPIGATGCRIVVTLLHAMAQRGARRGLATLCVSGGMGLSLLLERED
jgi:acetyl-CoA C-acetyltransferase